MKLLKEHKFIAVCAAAALILTAAVLFSALHTTPEDMEAQAVSIRETIEERALQCYVIENAYPESLSYLEEHYGLTVNKEDFKIIYTPFAENLPPDVRVIWRGNDKR